MQEELVIENILTHMEKKPRIKCGLKGKSNEREIVHKLNNRFAKILSENIGWGLFSRVLGSGNRYYQVSLSDNAKQTLVSDISCPPAFKFVIESKAGYDIDLCSIFDSGNKMLDCFLEQVCKDSEQTGKHPMLLWKKDRKPRLAFILSHIAHDLSCEYSIKYGKWVGVSFDNLLKLPDDFFFTKQ